MRHFSSASKILLKNSRNSYSFHSEFSEISMTTMEVKTIIVFSGNGFVFILRIVELHRNKKGKKQKENQNYFLNEITYHF